MFEIRTLFFSESCTVDLIISFDTTHGKALTQSFEQNSGSSADPLKGIFHLPNFFTK